MLAIKPGVTLLGLQPQLLVAIIAAHALYDHVDTLLEITSGNDGQHSPSSKHYAGAAIDLGVRRLPNAEVDGPIIASQLASMLGRDFDVIFEGDHIHIEWDPERPARPNTT
jgi:hypothetical protein